jgi:GTP-binding protein YchF
METLENKLHKSEKMLKSNDKAVKEQYEVYLHLKRHLENGRLAKYFNNEYRKANGKEKSAFLNELNLLTDKHILYVANVDDKNIHGNEYSKIVEDIAAKEGEEAIVLSVQIEAELSVLDAEEELEFLKELGIEEPGLDKLIHTAYHLLGLQTFFTAGEKEVHAWTVHKGAKAPQAAGEIHTDFEKGFIRAEVISYEDMIKLGSEHAVKEKGLMRVEGKEYEVRDGDIMFFRFNI